jgi:hypothetical protein
VDTRRVQTEPQNSTNTPIIDPQGGPSPIIGVWKRFETPMAHAKWATNRSNPF